MKTITFKTSSTIILLCAALSCANPSAAQEHAAAAVTSGALRIGIFDTRGVAMAYAGSSRPDCFMAKVDEIRAAHQKAEAAGDENKAKELEAQVVALSDKVHGQVFSTAAIDEILALIEDDMASIAEAAGVDLIVGKVLHQAAGVELVDITYHMCTPFELDEEGRQGIRELLAKKPVPLSELKHDH